MDSTEGGHQHESESSSSSTESSNGQQPPRPLDPTLQPPNSGESLKNLPNTNQEPVINRESVRVILSQRDYKHEPAGECRHSPMRTTRDRSAESRYSRDVDMVQLYRPRDERIPQDQSNQAYYSHAFRTEAQPVAPWERGLDSNIAERRSPRFENIQKESRIAPCYAQDQPQDSFASRDSAQNSQLSYGWKIPAMNSLTRNSIPYGTCAKENITSQGSTKNSLPYGDCAEDSKASSGYCTNVLREQIAEPVSQELQKYNSPGPSLAIAVTSNAMSEANQEPKQRIAPCYAQDQPQDSFASRDSAQNSQFSYGWKIPAMNSLTRNSIPYGTCAKENITSQGSTKNSLPYGDCAEDSKASSGYCTNIMREQIAEPVSQELQKYNSPGPSLAIAVTSNAMSEANQEPKQLVENVQLTIATQTEIDLEFTDELWRSIFDSLRMQHIIYEYDNKLIWFIALMGVMIPFLTVMKFIFYLLSLILSEF